MNLWDIGAALDDVNVGLHQIKNLLQIYDEHIEDELEFVRKHERDGGAGYFVDRYDLLRSLLEIIQLHTHNTAESLQKQIDAIYAASRAERQDLQGKGKKKFPDPNNCEKGVKIMRMPNR